MESRASWAGLATIFSDSPKQVWQQSAASGFPKGALGCFGGGRVGNLLLREQLVQSLPWQASPAKALLKISWKDTNQGSLGTIRIHAMSSPAAFPSSKDPLLLLGLQVTKDGEKGWRVRDGQHHNQSVDLPAQHYVKPRPRPCNDPPVVAVRPHLWLVVSTTRSSAG